MKDFIGISRCIIDHWVYKDAEYFKVWFEMLHRARFSKIPEEKLEQGQIVTIYRGQFIFGRLRWSRRLKISERRLRTLIKKLIEHEMIEVVKKHNKFTVYRIINYEKFNQQNDQQESQQGQGKQGIGDQQNDQQVTSKRPANDQQVTTQEEGSKTEGKKKKELNTYTPEFETFYKTYPKSEKKMQTFKNWKTVIKKHSVEEIQRAAERYLRKTEGKDRQYIVISSNFVGQNAVYLDYLDDTYEEPVSETDRKRAMLDKYIGGG